MIGEVSCDDITRPRLLLAILASIAEKHEFLAVFTLCDLESAGEPAAAHKNSSIGSKNNGTQSFKSFKSSISESFIHPVRN